MIHVRVTTQMDAYALIPELCDRDVDELASFYGVTATEGIMLSIKSSEICRTVLVGGRVAGVYGLCPPKTMLSEVARPWMLSASFALANPRAWVKSGRHLLAEMLQMYPVLENWADARHTDRIRWLKVMGFSVAEPQPFGIMGLPACRFTMARE